MADAKKSAKTTADIAKERENLVRQANEEQKLTATQSRGTKSISTTTK